MEFWPHNIMLRENGKESVAMQNNVQNKWYEAATKYSESRPQMTLIE